MPQAKFQVVGKFTGKDGETYRPGDIIDLTVDKEGKPVDTLAAARVRPFRGSVVGTSDVPQDVKDSVAEYVADAEAKAAQIVADAEAKAAGILDEAGQKAAQIVADAEASKSKK